MNFEHVSPAHYRTSTALAVIWSGLLVNPMLEIIARTRGISPAFVSAFSTGAAAYSMLAFVYLAYVLYMIVGKKVQPVPPSRREWCVLAPLMLFTVALIVCTLP
ncbi:MAG TPA: hypothetical protein VME66_04065 [Candidatus Acidoferrales bacterium]|nr:hypothetical protein [Candidatus Acidoferrales bacterium]